MTKVSRNASCPCGSGKKFKFCHGVNRPYPAIENVASIAVDKKLKRAIIVTKDILINQISRDGPRIAKSFDDLTKEDIKKISAVVADAMSLLFRHSLVDSQEYKPTCARLLSSALSAFMASIEVARHGYRRSYGVMARNVVETLATVLHIAIEHSALPEFHSGRPQSTKSIATAKKAIPGFGNLYGMFSNHFVHINQSHAALEPIISYSSGEEPLNFILSTLKVNSWLMYVTAELIFHEDIPNPRYWRHLGNGAFAFDPSDSERQWMTDFIGPEI